MPRGLKSLIVAFQLYCKLGLGLSVRQLARFNLLCQSISDSHVTHRLGIMHQARAAFGNRAANTVPHS